jgi:hypothetical protein
VGGRQQRAARLAWRGSRRRSSRVGWTGWFIPSTRKEKRIQLLHAGAPLAASASVATGAPHESNPVGSARSARTATSRPASKIDARPVDWLWPGRIPSGTLTVLAGDPGLGKSLLSLALASKLSRSELTDGPADVLLLTAEDSVAHTVVPRLQAARADLDRVHFASISQDEMDASMLFPEDIGRLRELVLAHQARLVVIDPLMAHLSAKIDSWKDQKVRLALAPLHRLAEETGSAILVVAHLNKGQGSDPLQRLGGSIGIAAAARSVLLLARDPDDPEGDQGAQRVLAHVKSNLSSLARSLGFQIEEAAVAGDLTAPLLRESGHSRYSGVELLDRERPRKSSKLEAAIELLETELQEGVRPVVELERLAEEAEISVSTLQRARKELKVQSTKLSFDRGWGLSLPAEPQPAPLEGREA